MLTPIHGLPDHVFGITATGEVDKADMDSVLLPGLQQLVGKYDEIYYLLVLQTDVGNFTAGSWVEDLKAGIKHFTKWKKIAVVTDQSGVEKFTDIFTVAVPGQARGFKLDELEEAKVWVAEKNG